MAGQASTPGVSGMARLWGSRRDGDLIAGWLDAITSAPDLRGASCTGKAPAFDYDNADDPRAQKALALCAACPVRQVCADWVNGLPEAAKPMGVVGGQIVGPLPERRKAARRRAVAATGPPEPPGRYDGLPESRTPATAAHSGRTTPRRTTA